MAFILLEYAYLCINIYTYFIYAMRVMEVRVIKTLKKTFAIALATVTLVACASKSETNSSNSQESQSSKKESSSSKSLPSIYKVTFQNYDGTILYETEVEEGDSAEYVGEVPTKPVEEEKVDYTYEFVGWDKELKNILEDTITTAMFKVKTEKGWGDIVWF